MCAPSAESNESERPNQHHDSKWKECRKAPAIPSRSMRAVIEGFWSSWCEAEKDRREAKREHLSKGRKSQGKKRRKDLKDKEKNSRRES
jgi:hypothetical protein